MHPRKRDLQKEPGRSRAVSDTHAMNVKQWNIFSNIPLEGDELAAVSVESTIAGAGPYPPMPISRPRPQAKASDEYLHETAAESYSSDKRHYLNPIAADELYQLDTTTGIAANEGQAQRSLRLDANSDSSREEVDQEESRSLGRPCALEWNIERVTAWLSESGFSEEWQEAFRREKIEGQRFLDLVSYPRLRQTVPAWLVNRGGARLCNAIRKTLERRQQGHRHNLPGESSEGKHKYRSVTAPPIVYSLQTNRPVVDGRGFQSTPALGNTSAVRSSLLESSVSHMGHVKSTSADSHFSGTSFGSLSSSNSPLQFDGCPPSSEESFGPTLLRQKARITNQSSRRPESGDVSKERYGLLKKFFSKDKEKESYNRESTWLGKRSSVLPTEDGPHEYIDSMPQESETPIPRKILVQVTKDGEQFFVVNLSHCDYIPSLIREALCEKVQVSASFHDIYLTEIGTEEPTCCELDDSALVSATLTGDSKGSLKFYVKSKFACVMHPQTVSEEETRRYPPTPSHLYPTERRGNGAATPPLRSHSISPCITIHSSADYFSISSPHLSSQPDNDQLQQLSRGASPVDEHDELAKSSKSSPLYFQTRSKTEGFEVLRGSKGDESIAEFYQNSVKSRDRGLVYEQERSFQRLEAEDLRCSRRVNEGFTVLRGSKSDSVEDAQLESQTRKRAKRGDLKNFDLKAHRLAPRPPNRRFTDENVDILSNEAKRESYYQKSSVSRLGKGITLQTDLPRIIQDTAETSPESESCRFTSSKTGFMFKVPNYTHLAVSASPDVSKPDSGSVFPQESPVSCDLSPCTINESVQGLESTIDGQSDSSPFTFEENLKMGEESSDDEGLWAVKPETRVRDRLSPVKSGTCRSPGRRVQFAAQKDSLYGSSPEYYAGDDKHGLNSPAVHSVHSSTPHPSPVNANAPSRRNSFARHDDVWAVRPPAEVLYDHLEEYFPEHDVDKPIIVESENEDMVSPLPGVPVPQVSRMVNRQTSRVKSMRVVAKEANEARKRFVMVAQGARFASMLRRKSTKVWGQKVVEMTPLQVKCGGLVEEEKRVRMGGTFCLVLITATFKWVKGELIGKGTYGHVYLAMNAVTGDLLAVKQVETPRTKDQRQGRIIDALNAEVETMKDLDHLNIVQYLGYERGESTISIFLEYIPGGSIGRCLRKHGKFETGVIRSLTRQTLEGLAYIHSKGILHRDLKADNILLDPDGVSKISDFGISKRSEDIYGNDANMSMQGSIFWMAPEVIQNQRQGYSAKIDIWSLGCVVLEMFAGRRPWSNDEAIGAMFKLGKERLAPPIPDDVQADLSPEAHDFLQACFTIDPEQRPTAEELLKHEFCEIDPNFNFFDSELAQVLERRKSFK